MTLETGIINPKTSRKKKQGVSWTRWVPNTMMNILTLTEWSVSRLLLGKKKNKGNLNYDLDE